MIELSDRQILDQELIRYSAAGWKVVSQSESSFQVVEQRVLNSTALAIFVFVPAILGMIVYVLFPFIGQAVVGFAIVCSILIMVDFFSKKSKLLYITAEQLRNRAPQK